ncbi:glycosyltransferase [Halorarum salinum]|uniref:Glycosyltransferase n=2 Tax=Halorarum salinum TaxID=2743089 RepID=A0A7D5QNH5_9EURY|nr:glycosyltransferase [Halobaculum salinum]
MRVLNLVTSPDAEFFRLQVDAIRRHGIEQTTLGVADTLQHTKDEMDSRSVLDYLRFYSEALPHAVKGYDLVHANYGLTAPPALTQPYVPVVLTLWGSDLFGPFGKLSRWCARFADAVIVMSREMADALEVDCHVIPHGVDLQVFRPFPQRQARKVIGWEPSMKHVLFPYPKLSRVKDYPRALQITEAARECVDGPVKLQSVYGVPHERMPLYMNAADALLLTSRREGSPNSVKEAMACNLPVVATDVGDVHERLRDVDPSHVRRTDAGLVDALVDVLERGPVSDGRAAIRPLSVEAMGTRIRDVYRSVLGTRLARAPIRAP